MIHADSFSKEWIESRFSVATTTYPTIEKMIYALSLLESMAKAKLSFTFKGGTSLSLLLHEITRFSTDIDIIASEGFEEEMKTSFDNNPFTKFTRYEKDERERTGIRKAHYTFFFDSLYTGKNTFVLLDIVYEKNPFTNLIPFEISSSLLSSSAPYEQVNIPCIDELLADKMTAFAPETIGILFTKNRHTEIIKQLYDISKLSEQCQNVDLVASTYSIISKMEIEHRDGEGLYTPQYCLDDSLDNCRLLLISNITDQTDNSGKLLNGIDGFGAFVTHSFSLIDAQVCAMKAYCIYVKVKCQSMEKFQSLLSQIPINSPSPSVLSRRTRETLKLLDQESFSSFCQCYEINKILDDESGQ